MPLGPFINQTVETCLQSFESTSWSERNAALQLFGALTPRILGQKKLRNESSGHNKVVIPSGTGTGYNDSLRRNVFF